MEPKTGKFKKAIKILLTIALCLITPIALLYSLVFFSFNMPQWGLLVLFIPALIPAVWAKRKKAYRISYLCLLLAVLIASGAQWGIAAYRRSITIDVTPNIDVHAYLPFEEDSKIVKIDSKTLKFDEDDVLPRIDGSSCFGFRFPRRVGMR